MSSPLCCRKLQSEYDRLKKAHDRKGLSPLPSPPEMLPVSPQSARDAELIAEAKLLRQHKGRLEARMQILEDRSQQTAGVPTAPAQAATGTGASVQTRHQDTTLYLQEWNSQRQIVYSKSSQWSVCHTENHFPLQLATCCPVYIALARDYWP